jgi:hypothetical protein
METRVLVTGRRFAGLQGLPEPESPRQVEVTPRAIGGGRAQEPQGEASVIDMAARGPEVVDVGA